MDGGKKHEEIMNGRMKKGRQFKVRERRKCGSCIYLRGVSESSRTVIVVTASVKDERRGQGHTSAILLHQSAT
jgi:hypothetical protein